VGIKKEEKRTPLEISNRGGILRGKVVYDGEPPIPAHIAKIDKHGDREGCLKGGPAQTREQRWMVDPQTRAVANIVLWVEPPPDKFFILTDKEKNRAGDVVVVDQPHCVFIPHVVTLYPSYYDGARQIPTGQQLEIRNSAPFLHTVQWDPSRENEAGSHNIPPGGGKIQLTLKPQNKCLPIGCGVHNWMHGILWIFEHPYHTVSKQDGSFELRDLPTGIELTVSAWHESQIQPFERRKIAFEQGENPSLELKIHK
jgi:hypothetical protein